FNVPTNVQRCDPFNIPTNVQRCDPFSVPINVQRYDPCSVPTNVQRCKPFIVVSRIKAEHKQVDEDWGGETKSREGETGGREGETNSLVEELETCRQIQGVLGSLCEAVSSVMTPSLLVVTPTIFLQSCYMLYHVSHCMSLPCVVPHCVVPHCVVSYCVVPHCV
ncbi:hypothetical protein OTU49_010651, partial [Cherax quadricarinatus]